MLALIAGTGGLPKALLSRLDTPPLVCSMQGIVPDLPVDLEFRIEHLGRFVATLKAQGVDRICMAGAIVRPKINPTEIDAATAPLVTRIAQAIAHGDDAALRIVIAIFEEAGFDVVSAQELAPDLLPRPGILTRKKPSDQHEADANIGESCVAQLGATDTGQACIIRASQVVLSEGPDGTAAMIAGVRNAVEPLIESGLISRTSDAGILFKAPKPTQDRRADLPLIGVDTARQAGEARLAGIVIEAGGVLVLDLGDVCEVLDAQGMFLWVRPRGVQ